MPMAATLQGKAADNILVPPLPAHGDYGSWRFSVISNIMCASARPDLADIFLKEIENPGVSDTMLVTNRNLLLVGRDHKLFAGIFNMLVAKQQASSDDSVRLLTRIRNCVNLGSGRQAMRVLDADFMREGPRRRQRASPSSMPSSPPFKGRGRRDTRRPHRVPPPGLGWHC